MKSMWLVGMFAILTGLTGKADAAPERLLYECRPFEEPVISMVHIYGPVGSQSNLLGQEEISRVSVRDAGAIEDRVSEQVINRPNSAGQAYQLFSTRDGTRPSGSFIITLYDVKDHDGIVPALFVLYPTTKRIEMPVMCLNMR